MVVWSYDYAAAAMPVLTGATGTGAALAGLQWLTHRWPDGTIRNEAEVYSG
jgi:hypothetical protein